MNNYLVKVNNLSVVINKKQILDNVSFSMEKGKIVTIIGPNGSGKTTLVRCILKLIQPTSGEIWNEPNLSIGYVPQKINLNNNLPLTVLDFLGLEVNTSVSKAQLDKVVKEVGINNILLHPLQKISGGEMQRTLVARALLKKPKLLILDEPNQGVDISGQVEFYKLIDRLRLEQNISSLIISHDLHMVMKNTDYVICLHHHICCEGTVNSVQEDRDFYKLFKNNDSLMNFSIYSHHHDHKH